MKNGRREDNTKQRTTNGAEIPVPKQADFMKALRKVPKASPTRPRPK